MSADAFGSVFTGPGKSDFPFRDSGWIAVAFERNAHGHARMPEWFFRAAAKRFNGDGAVRLLIAGDCFAQARFVDVCVVPFEWDRYREFMSRPELGSIEYRMASSDRMCGGWADADLTVFGGEPEPMTALLADLGGAGRLLQHMRQEFLLGDAAAYPDMDLFFRRLLFPELRG
ncbi:hypothetical protein K4L06_02120 [Lysobacter sp. BMK333-48F3]|uniref:hypothetical protein n=1 Tax=Lysobacter sp. BMK333-48F3 TaxID=2867962 RepID=UPI001C8B9E9C|nr:hypothetical protein [Lysobacter sp. BMK333-48F3]MBX9400090.1 hypothetical protein [Lysobacter sp. BMK333-48F3]